jgi:uncharacterized protein YecA (UPF0149 family)
MNRKDRTASQLTPGEVQPALEFVALLEKAGQMTPQEAEEWRRRIDGWARFNAVEAETAPSA